MVANLSGVPTGIRTPVPTVKGLCPRPLDDGDLDFGAGNEARTRDINLGKVALYQLSYSRAVRISILMNFQTLSSFLFIFLLVRGGSAETRTLDRRIKSPLLYQLSYAPIASKPIVVRDWWERRDSNSGPTD